jgi:hypothetical protein
LYQLEPKKFVETERVWIYWPDDIVTISLSVYESLHTRNTHATHRVPTTKNTKYMSAAAYIQDIYPTRYLTSNYQSPVFNQLGTNLPPFQ